MFCTLIMVSYSISATNRVKLYDICTHKLILNFYNGISIDACIKHDLLEFLSQYQSLKELTWL